MYNKIEISSGGHCRATPQTAVPCDYISGIDDMQLSIGDMWVFITMLQQQCKMVL